MATLKQKRQRLGREGGGNAEAKKAASWPRRAGGNARQTRQCPTTSVIQAVKSIDEAVAFRLAAALRRSDGVWVALDLAYPERPTILYQSARIERNEQSSGTTSAARGVFSRSKTWVGGKLTTLAGWLEPFFLKDFTSSRPTS